MKILLPIHDPGAERATLNTAMYLCEQTGLTLEILHVQESDAEDVDLSKLRLLQKHAQLRGLDVELRLAVGRPVKEIITRASDVAIVVLKNRTQVDHLQSGLFRLSELRGGSAEISPVTRGVLKHTPTLALVTFGTDSTMKRPLIAYNGSFTSKAVLRNALLLLAKSVIHGGLVLYVGPPSAHAEKALAEAVQLGRDFELEFEAEVVDDDPRQALLYTARQRRCDMLIMGAYGRTWVEHAVRGSVTEAVLSSSDIPVLLG